MVKWMCSWCGAEYDDPVKLDQHLDECEERPFNQLKDDLP